MHQARWNKSRPADTHAQASARHFQEYHESSESRDPQPEELAACRDYLDRQIELVDPKVIVTLGRFSMARYFPGASISKIHGQPKRVGDRLIVPMFHPAAALHQPKWRPQIIEDFSKLPQFIAQAATFSQPTDDEIDPDSAEQLSLF